MIEGGLLLDIVKREEARKRVLVITRVMNGEITATQAADLLNMSRKSYYKWEERFMENMLSSVEDRAPGRPSIEKDLEKGTLKKQLKDQSDQILALRMGIQVRDEIMEMPEYLEWKERFDKNKKKRRKKRQ